MAKECLVSVLAFVCRTQRQSGEVDGVAVGAVAPFVPSSDLESVYWAGNQRGDSQGVGLAVHTCCTVHIWTLRDTEWHIVVLEWVNLDLLMLVRNTAQYVYLVVESYLVLQDVSVGPVRLRPWESDGVWGSAQLVHHGNSTGNCGKTSPWARLDSVLKRHFLCYGHKGAVWKNVQWIIKVE